MSEVLNTPHDIDDKLLQLLKRVDNIYVPRIEVSDDRPVTLSKVDVTEQALLGIKMIGLTGRPLFQYLRQVVHDRIEQFPSMKTFYHSWDDSPGSTFMQPENQMLTIKNLPEPLVKERGNSILIEISQEYLTPLYKQFNQDCCTPGNLTLRELCETTNPRLNPTMHIAITKAILRCVTPDRQYFTEDIYRASVKAMSNTPLETAMILA